MNKLGVVLGLLLWASTAWAYSAYPYGDFHWKAPSASVAALPVSGNGMGDARTALDTFDVYVWTGSAWHHVGGGGGGGVSDVTATAPIVSSGGATPNITCNVASGSQPGCLSSADWTTFNSKFNLPALTSGSVLFSNGTTIAQDHANFFWDNVGKTLEIGDLVGTSPFALTVVRDTADTSGGDAGAGYFENNSTNTVNSSGLNTPLFTHESTQAATGVAGAPIAGAFFQAFRDTGAADLGVIPVMAGSFSAIQQISTDAAATTNVAAGVLVQNQATSGVIGSLADFYSFPTTTSGATITNLLGIYISPPDVGSKSNWLSGSTLLGGSSYATPNAALQVVGSITEASSVTDAGVEGVQAVVSSHTTVDGSNTTVGNQTAATGIVDATFTNDKLVSGAINTITRGNGTDDGTLHALAGVNSLLFINSGAAGVTDEVDGDLVIEFLQQGTTTNMYDFHSQTVPAGTGVVTNAFGVYIEPNNATPKKSWLSGSALIGGTSFHSPAHDLEVSADAQVDGVFFSATNSQPSLDTNNRVTLDNAGIQFMDWSNRVFTNSSLVTLADFSGSVASFPSDVSTNNLFDLTSSKAFDVLNRVLFAADGTTHSVETENRLLIRSDTTTAIDWQNSTLKDVAGVIKADWSATGDPMQLVTGAILEEGHLISHQAAVLTTTVLAAAGAGSTVGVAGTDTAGYITYVSAGVPTSGDLFKVNYTGTQPYTNPPVVTLTRANVQTGNGSMGDYIDSPASDATQFTVAAAGSPITARTYIWSYHVIEARQP